MRHARGRAAHRSQLLFGSAGTQVLIALILAFAGLLTTMAPQGPVLTLDPQEVAAQGDVWAYGGELVDYTGGIYNTTCPGGIWMGSPTGGSPEVVLGAPDDRDISLGWGGSVTINFERPARGSGDSDPDVFVWELGMGEVYDVYVSEDGGTYTWVGQATPLEPGQQGFDVDHAGFNEGSRINYIRVTDSQPGRDPMSCYLFEGENYSQDGVDIDAVGVLTPAPFAELTLDKVSDVGDGDPVLEGDEITYTFEVENTGNVDLTNVTVTDPLPGLSEITPPSADIPEGGSQTFSATYIVTQEDVDAGEIVNEATATGDAPDGYEGDPPSDTDDETVTIEQEAALEIVKTADTDGPVAVGDEITYTFEVENTGTVTVTDVTIDDPMEGLTWVTGPNVGDLAPGDTATGTATYIVTDADLLEGVVDNSATATGEPPESCVDCDPTSPPSEETVTTDPPVAALELLKTADTAGPVNVGDEITYTFEVTNVGTVTITDVTIDDPMEGLTWVTGPELGDLGSRESATGTATYIVTAADIDTGLVTNSATSTGNPPEGCEDCDPTSPPDEVEIPTVDPGLAIDKMSSVAADETVTEGDTITYTFSVENTGEVDLTDVTVTDDLEGLSAITPASADIPVGESATFTATYVVTAADVANGSIENSATATGSCGEGCTTTSDPDEEIVTVEDPEPGIEIAKTSDVVFGETVAEDDTVTYFFAVTNTGNVPLTDVTVTDLLPGLTWGVDGNVIPELGVEETVTLTATYMVTAEDVINGSITNTASVTGNPPEECTTCTPPTDEDTEITPPEEPAPGLTLVKTADTAGPVAEGDTITYTFTVENTGNVTLTGITVEDAMPGLTWVTGPEIAEIGDGDTVELTATYMVTDEDVANGSVNNSATLTCEGDCGELPPPSEVEVPTEDPGEPGLSIDKESDVAEDETVGEGDTITYTFTVENTGTVDLIDVTINDNLEGLSAITPASADIPVGESATFTATYVVTSDDVANGSIVNSATAMGDCEVGCDEPPVSPPDEEIVIVEGEPGLSIDKTADTAGPVRESELITYWFEVTNTGTVPLADVTITDDMPGLVWTVGPNVGDLAPGDSVTGSAYHIATAEDIANGSIENTATVDCAESCVPEPPADTIIIGGAAEPDLRQDGGHGRTGGRGRHDYLQLHRDQHRRHRHRERDCCRRDGGPDLGR